MVVSCVHMRIEKELTKAKAGIVNALRAFQWGLWDRLSYQESVVLTCSAQLDETVTWP